MGRKSASVTTAQTDRGGIFPARVPTAESNFSAEKIIMWSGLGLGMQDGETRLCHKSNVVRWDNGEDINKPTSEEARRTLTHLFNTQGTFCQDTFP